MRSYGCRGHVLAVPYPSQGHINPMYQFCKRLASKGIKASLVLTTFISNSFNPQPSSGVAFETISDGHDYVGFAGADCVKSYLKDLETNGYRTLWDVVARCSDSLSGNRITCVVADPFLPWALDVSRDFSIKGALFFTQSCSVNYIYYLVYQRKLKVPISSDTLSIEGGLPLLERKDMPSFIRVEGSNSGYCEMVLNQFSNADKADIILVNSFYELESQEVDTMSKLLPILTIGPTIPSSYFDKRVKDDTHYGLDLFTALHSCTKWLDTKPEGSVVYVSFGSMANLSIAQMEELCWGLDQSGFHFFWVVRESEQPKLPGGFLQKTKGKGVVVNWSNQLEVLSNESIGCFVSHCGWNSTTEALSLGVPVVAMPQWTDQTMNAKYVVDVWRVGLRVKVDEGSGIAKRDEIKFCLKEVMEGKKGREIRKNARKWRELAIEAVSEGGSSDRNVDALISKIV